MEDERSTPPILENGKAASVQVTPNQMSREAHRESLISTAVG